jgi:pimeloyl-ACP methyl ester carboxylesterase
MRRSGSSILGGEEKSNEIGEFQAVAKPKTMQSDKTVRTRRAYFDCRFGQLHVRTAFPATGGFDEQVTLFCLHPDDGSSRMFARFLPQIAGARSVYAPDLPGRGESDPSPSLSVAEAAAAISDLAGDLRLKQIDLLGVHTGIAVALDLAAARPELVRRMVLVGIPPAGGIKAEAAVPNGKFVDVSGYADDPFNVAAQKLAGDIDAFLTGRA